MNELLTLGLLSSMILANTDAWIRLLSEFETISDVAQLRCCNKSIKKVIDEHPERTFLSHHHVCAGP